MEIITFLILEDDLKFLREIEKLIERQLTEMLGIECRIETATKVQKALGIKNELKIDIHIIDIDLPGRGNGFDYLAELAKDYTDDEPVLPVIMISSHEEDVYKIRALDKFGVIGFIGKSKYNDELALSKFKKAVKMIEKYTSDETVTFTRPGEERAYKEKHIWTITKVSKPNRSKKILVTIYDEDSGEVIEETFSLKKSLREVPGMFSDPKSMVRCHKSYLVNPRAVIGRRGDQLLLRLGVEVPLGGEYAESFTHLGG